MRQATKTTVLPVGGGPDASSPILVRKGEAVSYSVYAMHRRKDVYGEDADRFRPDRWEVGSAKGGPDLRDIGWGYLPFNGGPRVCLGRECDLSLFATDGSRSFPNNGATLLILLYEQKSSLYWKLRIRLCAFCRHFRISRWRRKKRWISEIIPIIPSLWF